MRDGRGRLLAGWARAHVLLGEGDRQVSQRREAGGPGTPEDDGARDEVGRGRAAAAEEAGDREGGARGAEVSGDRDARKVWRQNSEANTLSIRALIELWCVNVLAMPNKLIFSAIRQGD